MRARVTVLILSLVAVSAAIPMAAPVQASVVLAQEDTTNENEGVVGEEDESQGTEDTGEEGSGQNDEEAETGADEGETAEGASTEEEGPPWTYQMARIGIVLLVLIAALIGWWYYKMIVVRQRGEA